MDTDFAVDLSSFKFGPELYNTILEMVSYTLSLPYLPRIIEININDGDYQTDKNLILYLLEVASKISSREEEELITKVKLFRNIFNNEDLYMVYKPFLEEFQYPMIWGDIDSRIDENDAKKDLIFRLILDRDEPVSNREEIDMIISYFYYNDIPLYIRRFKLQKLQNTGLQEISRREFILLIEDLFSIKLSLNFDQDPIFEEELPPWMRPKKTPSRKVPRSYKQATTITNYN